MAAEFENGGSGGSPFDGVDAKLTIYALANGMDLIKEDGARRLEWYRDGMDRGILVRAAPDGTLEVAALAWSGDPQAARRTPLGEPMTPGVLAAELSTLLDRATEAANDL